MTGEPRLLSTNLLDEAILKKAADFGVSIQAIPFIAVEKINSTSLQQQLTVLSLQRLTIVFTSQNAVEAVTNILINKPDWKIYCLAGNTAKAIRNFWNDGDIKATATNATELAQQIINDKIKIAHFFCGDNRREELPALLRNDGVILQEIIVYRTVQTPIVITDVFDGILFFSPSAVESFFSVNTLPSKTTIFAIGPTTANAIQKHTNSPIITSEFPSKEALVDLAVKHLIERKHS